MPLRICYDIEVFPSRSIGNPAGVTTPLIPAIRLQALIRDRIGFENGK